MQSRFTNSKPSLKRLRCLIHRGLVSGGATCVVLSGCTTYVQQPPSRADYPPPVPVREVYTPPPAPIYAPPPVAYVPPPTVQVEVGAGAVEVVIRTEEDFYQPLSEYGRW